MDKLYKDSIKNYKKQIKQDPANLDLRLKYISFITDNKKKILEYDYLISEEFHKLNKNYLESNDLKRITIVCNSYIDDCFKLGYIEEGLECGFSYLKISLFDEQNIRFKLVNNLFKLNRLNDYERLYLSFNTPYDLFSHLIFYATIDNFLKFTEIKNLIIEKNPGLLNLIIGLASNDELSNKIFNQYYEAYILAKDKIINFLNEA